MAEVARYYSAACQTDLPCPRDRAEIPGRVAKLLGMVDRAVVGYEPFFDIKLVVFPEFAHAAPIYETVDELIDRLAVPIPNEHTDRYVVKAKERGTFIQTGSFLEVDSRWPGVVFNTTCLIGPDGLLSRYRKVNPWLPWEVHASPHDLAGYDEPLFPVVETEIGRLGAAICYDWLFPEAIRALALAGAEVLIRVSAYMDPWGASPPLDWWTLFNRARAVENFAYVVAANQGASAENYPPFSWPGGSMIVDFDGRVLAQADPGPGEKIVVGPIDLAALRYASEGVVEAITSFPICGPMPILNFTLGLFFALADALHELVVTSPPDPSALATSLCHSHRPGRVSRISFILDSTAQRIVTMRPRNYVRLGLVLVSASGLLAMSACRSDQPEPDQSPTGLSPALSRAVGPESAPALKNQGPPDDLSAHFKGLGHMERYEYRDAVEAFREIHSRAPGWIPGAINLAIALLNDSGVEAEKAQKAGGEPAPDNFDEALSLLAGVLERDPNHPYAHFCTGIILEQRGQMAEANEHFKRVTEIDPNDATSWYWRASTSPDRESPTQPTGSDETKEKIALFRKALDLDPYLVPAIYKMAMIERFSGGPKITKELLEQFSKLNPDRLERSPGPGDTSEKRYGEMGKYATVINPFHAKEREVEIETVPPNFEAAQPLQTKLKDGERWVKPSDFSGPTAVIGRARARFGAAVSVFDADGDGRDDLYLTSAVLGPKGIHDVLLLNKGDGRFEDASAIFGLPLDRASIGVAAADFDADRRIDLFLTGVGSNRLLRNHEGKKFDDISTTLKLSEPPAISLMARWLDLDQDGDLDLYVVNYCSAENAEKAFINVAALPPGLANRVYRNDGQPAEIPTSPMPAWAPLAVAAEVKAKSGLSIVLTPWTEVDALTGGNSPHTGIAALDIDNDRDLDLVLSADGTATIAVLNDRLGQFHVGAIKGVSSTQPNSGLLVTDLDADGRIDLVAPSAEGGVLVWRNTTVRTTAKQTELSFETWPINATRWRVAQAVDLDLDGRPDLLGLPVPSSKSGDLTLPSWARNERTRYSAKALPLRLQTAGLEGLAAVDLVGDPLLDILVIPPGEPPTLARNLGNGQHWLALQLGGHWGVKPQLMRTNSHAFGTRVVIEGQGIYATYDHTTPESGLGQSIAPIVLGLGNQPRTDLVHLHWPDGVMQCELNVSGNQKLQLTENNRKTGSCPVLFTWNGRRFVCIGDFLGGGGLGYLVAPSNYGQPDRDEAVAINAEQLQPSEGVFRVSITEPMDEVAYLDQISLEVVDRPPGISTTPDERFAPDGPRPTGELLAWRTTIDPIRAFDLEGRDVTETLRHWDRRTVDKFLKRDGWIGYTTEHGVVLDFGDRLSRYGPTDALVLCLAGWVEYPYSQTNYAAATAGITLKPPAIERQRVDGSWETIEPHAGYPAGMPRLMTIDLTGKLAGPRCVLRIKTNMECYYDQAMIAVRDRAAEKSLRVSTLPVARAALGYRGYTREVSPDGRQPLIYDYDYIDPAPLARFSGKLTRYGEVSGLLHADDDRLCLVGPGDEVRIEFEATSLPPLAEGWTRSFVLRTIGYCKDADPFTAISDSIEPLPWRDMPAFPFARDIKRPSDPAYESYLREYQTRPAGGGE